MPNESSRYSRYFTYIKPVTRLPIVKTYGSVIFTLFVMVFFIVYAIKPTIETILVLQKNLADENQILEKVTLKAKNLSTGKQNYDNMDPAIKTKISTAVPDMIEISTLTSSLEQTAKAHDASISALQIQPLILTPPIDNTVGDIAHIDFIFNVEGNYPNLVNLLQDLKSSARLISVDNLSLAKLAEGDGLVLSITGKAYYIK